MHQTLKAGFIVILLIGIAFLIMIIWGYQMVTRSLPTTQGKIQLTGLKAEVRVYRDGYHIPHIIAQNEHDIFFAQGFVTAQDRLWQMDLWRRKASGRLSEIFGSATLKKDSLMLTLGINRTAKRILSQLSPESYRVYQAYTKGVNAYIQKNKKHLPVEFTLLNYRPYPWQVEDCIAVLRLFGWQLNANWAVETTLRSVIERVGIEKSGEIFPVSPYKLPTSIFWKGQSLSTLLQAVRSFWDGESLPGISGNSWAVSGECSVTGKPLLASIPNFFISTLSLWYENHLVGSGFNVTGLSLPGFPLILIGYNERIAWGMTNLPEDDMDFFIEELSPTDPTQYVYGDTYRPIKGVEEKILLRGDSTIQMIVRETHRGPILTQKLHPKSRISSAISICWTGRDLSDEALAFYNLNRAEDWNSFQEALRNIHVPSQSFVYADRDGNIGYQAVGKIPLRTKEPGFLPRSGKDPKSDWMSYIPYDDLPSIKNPKEGFITSANQQVKGTEKYLCPIFGLWNMPSSSQRIRQFLSKKEQLSVNDFKHLQADVLSVFAEEVLNLVLPVLENTPFNDPLDKELFKSLSQWGGQMKTGSFEAALFEVFLNKLTENMFRDEMGDSLYNAYIELSTIPLAVLLRLLKEENSSWFDNVTTHEVVEDKQEIIIKSYQEAVTLLRGRWGDKTSKWSWGDLHTLVFEHPLGGHSLLEKAFNLGPFHVNGSGTTVNCMEYNLNNPQEIIWGPSARLIVDLGSLDNSISVIPTGQCGQPLDDHYRDQVHLYLGNFYHPNLSDTTKIARAGWNLLTLEPGVKNE